VSFFIIFFTIYFKANRTSQGWHICVTVAYILIHTYNILYNLRVNNLKTKYTYGIFLFYIYLSI